MDHQQVLFLNLDGIQALRQEAIKQFYKQKKRGLQVFVKVGALLREFFDIWKFSSEHVDIVYERHDVLKLLNH